MEGNIKKLAVFVILAAVVGLGCACATLPPTQAIRDLKDIAGKWEGIAEISLGENFAATGPTTLPVKESGDWENTWFAYSELKIVPDAFHRSGSGYLTEGKFHTGRGTYILHEGSGKWALVLDTPASPFKSVQFELAQK